jgi:hypothetical protein
MRSRQRRWKLRIGAVLAVVWLNVMLQPCVMAAIEHNDCAHCAAQTHQEHGGGADLCGHALQIDADAVPPKLVSDEDPEPSGITLGRASPGDGIRLGSVASSFVVQRWAAPPGPPLHVRFCVYLN